MLPSKWTFYYDRPILAEELEAIEELKSIEGQEVKIVYLYDDN